MRAIDIKRFTTEKDELWVSVYDYPSSEKLYVQVTDFDPSCNFGEIADDYLVKRQKI